MKNDFKSVPKGHLNSFILSSFHYFISEQYGGTNMNKEWDLTPLYRGIDTPEFRADCAEEE